MNSPDKEAFSKKLYQILLIAAAYLIAGRLSLLLAIPPGYASPVWPAAGIALAGVLLYGYRVWPGILLGSFLVNLFTTASFTFSALLLPFTIASGAALQAFAGAYLIRRYSIFPVSLEKTGDIFTVIILGGPLSCLISSLIGSASLLVSGSIGTGALLTTWWTWWTGDSVGVVIIMTIVSVWTLGYAYARKRLAIISPIIIAVLLTILLFLTVRADEWERVKLEFNNRADRLAMAVIQETDANIDILYFIQGLFEASQKVERTEFHDFVEQLFLKHNYIQALEWIPRIPDAQRKQYEKEARGEGYTDFQIRELDTEGKMVTIYKKKEYYPAYYVEPYKGNEKALGLDLSSNPASSEAMERSRDEAGPVATSRITLVQEQEEKYGVLVFLPIFKGSIPKTVQERQKDIEGFALSVIRIGDLIDGALRPFDLEGLNYSLFDETPAEGRHLLYTSMPLSDDEIALPDYERSDGIYFSVGLDFGGRIWKMVFTPSSEYLAAISPWEEWAVLTGGLLFTSMLGIFVLFVAGRTAITESLIEEKTGQLKESETRVRAVVDNILDGIITMNEERIVDSFNPGAERIFGYRASEVIGHNVNMLQPEPYHSHHDEYVQNYLRTGIKKVIGVGRELEGQRKNGEKFPIELAVTEMWVGVERKFVGIIRDISERKKAESDLRESEEKFRTLAENIHEVFWIAAADGSKVLYISPAYEDVWGQKRDDLYNDALLWMRTILPQYHDKVEESFTYDNLIKGGFDIEYQIRRPDNTTRWIHDKGTPIIGNDGEIHSIVGVAADISKFKEIDQLKSMFIASMSHELRTPLNSIIGFVGIILQGMAGDISDEQKDMLSRSYGAAKHLLALITDVIDISKIEAGKIEAFAEEFMLHDLMKQAFSTLRMDIDAKGLLLETDIPENLKLNTDRQRLLQCVLNFLSNAVKYSEKGKIKVSAVKEGETVEIQFTDTGIGIRDKDLPKLFGSFVRLDTPLKVSTKGTGLGLYLTKKLTAEVLNGTIEVNSVYGKGSTFILKIPVTL